MKEDYAHIDLGNQIDNSWNKDTALAIKFDGFVKTIKIRAEDKKEIRNKYIKKINTRKDNRANRKIVVIIYSFMLFKLLNDIRSIVNKVKVCNDISPHEDVYSFIRAISTYYNVKNLDEDIKIRFKDYEDGKSKAHNIANKTYKGRRKEDYLIKKNDIADLILIIEKIRGKDGS